MKVFNVQMGITAIVVAAVMCLALVECGKYEAQNRCVKQMKDKANVCVELFK